MPQFSQAVLIFKACVPSFRDTVLMHQPMFLEVLLTRAVDSEPGFDKVVHYTRSTAIGDY